MYPDLYILRHGETTWNLQGRYQGRQDSPLTEKGRNQALVQRELLNGLYDLPSKVFISPLGRAIETARLAVTLGDRPVIDERLQEISFGNWEGLLKEDIAKNIHMFNNPEGETFGMISARVQEFLDDLDQPAIIVTHGITSIVLRGLWLGLDQVKMLELSTDQGCIYHLSNGTETIMR
jgi:probable phosphoglycerate mutase